MKRTHIWYGVALALGGSAQLIAAQAQAQDTVLVTAQRREQDLQEVPVSIVALTGENLEVQGLDSLEDIGNYIPNINIQGGGAGTYGPTFRVRGLPNVGLYVDGVWQVDATGFLTQEWVDVDRIEVLRGPQGTTYGRDAVGGAIRIWTAEPAEEFGMSVTATTGTYDRRDIKATIDLPLSDNLLTRWTVSDLSRNGFIQSVSVDRAYGESDQNVFRGDILWTPRDNLSLRFVHSQDELDLTEPRIQDAIFDTGVIPGPDGIVGTADDVQNWGVLMKDFYALAIETNPGAYPGFLPYTPENFTSGYSGGRLGKWQTASDTARPSQVKREQTTIDLNWDITDSISAQFLTAYTEVDSDISVDWDGSNYDIVSDLIRNRLEVFSEEIQFSGSTDRISWVAGLYYWDEQEVSRADRRTLGEFFTFPGRPAPTFDLADVMAHPQCVALADPLINTTGAQDCGFAAFFAENIFAYDNLTFDNQDGIALFGEATVTLTDTLDFTFGVRHHDQDVNAGAMAFIPGVTAPQSVAYDVLHTGGDPFAGTPIINPDAPPVTFDEQTIKLALQKQFTDNVMGYVSYSEGFNSGGLDSVTTTETIWFSYDPEVIENTEIGVRADLADGLVRLNATYFDSDWTNIQNAGVVRDPVSGVELPQLATTNVGTANASGLELELTLFPSDNFLVNFNLGLLDTEYTDIAAGTSFLDTSTEFSQAPELTYNIGLQHTASLNGGGSLTTRVDYAYSDQFWRSLAFLRLDQYGVKNGGPIPANFDESGDWGTINARLTFEPAEGDYSVALFGTNLTDEYMLNSGFFHGIWGYDFATVGRPREVGVSLTMRFD